MNSKLKPEEGLSLAHIKNDFPAGLVVFLVALPLCLGIALASGAPLFAGIIAGVVGGIVVSIASNSSLSVSGPAAGLTVIVLTAITKLGYENFLVAVAIGGLIQIILGYLRAGIIGHYFPSSVIKGMLAAIGLILIFKQIPHALGYDKDSEGDFAFIQMDGENTFSEIINSLNYIHPGAVIISVISLAVLLFWRNPTLLKLWFFRTVPAPLAVVGLGIFLNLLFQAYFPGLALSGDHLVVLPVPDSINGFFSQFTLPNFGALQNPEVYTAGVTLAIIASLETLLSVQAADKLDPYKRHSSTSAELKAQGLGNFISGMIGGLPITAVIVRSSANINAGGKTKLSSLIHGIFLLFSVIFLANFLNMIPLACLASVLLLVGYGLSKVSLFKSMGKLGMDQFIPFLVTIISILLTDLLKGIGIGMALSIFLILRNNYRRAYFFHHEKHHEGDRITIRLSEDVTFLNKGSILITLDTLPENSIVEIDGSQSENIDLDVLEIIHDFKEKAIIKNIRLELKDIPEYKGISGH